MFYVYSSLLAADQHWSLKIKYGNIWFNIDFYLYFCHKYKLTHWRELFNIHVTLYIDSVLYASPVKVDRMSFGTTSTVDSSIPQVTVHKIFDRAQKPYTFWFQLPLVISEVVILIIIEPKLETTDESTQEKLMTRPYLKCSFQSNCKIVFSSCIQSLTDVDLNKNKRSFIFDIHEYVFDCYCTSPDCSKDPVDPTGLAMSTL